MIILNNHLETIKSDLLLVIVLICIFGSKYIPRSELYEKIQQLHLTMNTKTAAHSDVHSIGVHITMNSQTRAHSDIHSIGVP